MSKLALAAALGTAAILTATGVQAQLVRQESRVTTGVAPSPLAPAAPAIATATVQVYQPVCELRREQFQDEFGWRVRDIRICR